MKTMHNDNDRAAYLLGALRDLGISWHNAVVIGSMTLFMPGLMKHRFPQDVDLGVKPEEWDKLVGRFGNLRFSSQSLRFSCCLHGPDDRKIFDVKLIDPRDVETDNLKNPFNGSSFIQGIRCADPQHTLSIKLSRAQRGIEKDQIDLDAMNSYPNVSCLREKERLVEQAVIELL